MILAAMPEYHALPRERRLALGYEALCADPRGEIDRLAGFLGVAAPHGWLEKAAQIPEVRPARWRSLPRDEQRALSAWTEAARAAVAAWGAR